MKKFIMTAAIALTILGTVSVASAATFTWTPNQPLVMIGSRGQQVMQLQECLAELGNNPISNKDGIFGNITAQAVRNFQADHNASTGNNIYVDGKIGNQTGPLYTAACADAADGDVDVEEDFVLGGEGDVSGYDLDLEDDADSNDSDQHIATIEFDVDDGDVELESINLVFAEVVNNTDDVWENIERVTLVVDGEEIASERVDDEDDWKEESESSPESYRLSLLGSAVFSEDDNYEIEIVIDTTDKVEGADVADYDLWAELRFVNGEGVTLYLGDDSEIVAGTTSVEFAIVPEAAGDVTLSESDDNPDAMVIEGDDTDDTEKVDVLIFEVEIDDRDIILDEISIDLTVVTTGTATENDDLVSKVYLYHDGDLIDSVNPSAAIGGAETLVFDLDKMEIDEDDTEEFVIKVNIEPVDGTVIAEGDTLLLDNVDLTDIEDAQNDDLVIAVSGSAEGETHAVYTNSPRVTLEDVSLELHQAKDGILAGEEDIFVAHFEFELTAGADDVFIPLVATDGGAMTDALTFDQDGAGVILDVAINADVDLEKTNSYRISSRNTETFMYDVYITADDTLDRITITGINWALTDVALATDTLIVGLEDFRTLEVFLAK